MSNAPNEYPEEEIARYERDRERQRRGAERQVAHLCEALRFFGVRKVTAAFDAYGDEGSIKEAVIDPLIGDELPFGLIEAVNYWWTSFRTTGWGWNFSPKAGLDGVLVLDVATGKVVEEFGEFRAEDLEGEPE
jgi:hypothetical protein